MKDVLQEMGFQVVDEWNGRLGVLHPVMGNDAKYVDQCIGGIIAAHRWIVSAIDKEDRESNPFLEKSRRAIATFLEAA